MFKNKILTRSEVDIKLYFKTWMENIEKTGFTDPSRFAEGRRKMIEEAEEVTKPGAIIE